MDYEKKYKEALKRAEGVIEQNPLMEYLKKGIEYIFPELKESEDERIKNWLIGYFHQYKEDGMEKYANGLKVESILAWLEKQGEQKLADKVIKPKFHEGDWIVFNGLTLYVKEVIKGFYRTISKGGITNSYDWDIDNAARLWTIQDAKEGDVLACENGWTCIFSCLNDNLFSSHCFMDAEGWFCEDGGQAHALDNRICGEIHPATKEQRDILFEKMHEAKYMWDSESKQLLSLKAEPSDEQKTAWSEEDEENFRDIVGAIHAVAYQTTEDEESRLEWLYDIKQRMGG